MMPKLPKFIETHPQRADIEARLALNSTPLWSASQLSLPKWQCDSSMRQSIAALGLAGHLSQGLEAAGSELAREQHGLNLMLKKTGQAQNQRMSRFLLLSNDGAERFYRDAESLMIKHRNVLAGAIIDLSSEELGSLLTPPKKMVKAVLIHDRKALERFLLSLVDPEN